MAQYKSIDKIRHSFAHLLAQAVLELHPNAKLGIGPAIENGFYYDFGDVTIGDSDLAAIENKMKEIAKRNLPIKKELWPAKKAKIHFQKEKQPYKLELINDLALEEPLKTKNYKPKTAVGMVHTGSTFLDLCRGGHVANTKNLPMEAFKLTHTAGAYWRGDEKRPMLTRIYGAAFATKSELEEYLKQREEAQARDHKKLGRELGLFTFSELVGAGLPLFTPRGTVILQELQKFSEQLKREAGYSQVHIPHIAKKELYKISGHLEKFGDDIFYVKGRDSEFILKPMNCPHHTQIYAAQPRSYRDLPIRIYETTTGYRDEQAGELGGLTRVRSITTDDSHAFAREDQIEEEFKLIISGTKKVVSVFGLKNAWIRLSLRDEKNKKAYLGEDKIWREAQQKMEHILHASKMKFEKAEGEAAFYGPKMDFMINDALGRQWQIATIQLDLNMPSRFGLTYTDKDGKARTPVMIHSAFLGSLERFMGIIIENYGGAFPAWLAPEQVWVLPVSDKFNVYGRKVANALADTGLRVVLREETESLGKKIRAGLSQKIPYLLIIGDKEKNAGTLAVRSYKKGDIGAMKLDEFAKKIKNEIEKKK